MFGLTEHNGMEWSGAEWNGTEQIFHTIVWICYDVTESCFHSIVCEVNGT